MSLNDTTRQQVAASITRVASLEHLPVVLGVAEAAAIAGVCERTIRSWIEEHRLRAGRAGVGSSRIRILRDDLLAFLGLGGKA
jgi:excisionase family DNA binding protein